MEKTGCKIICGAPTTFAIKALMMMMMMMMICPQGKELAGDGGDHTCLQGKTWLEIIAITSTFKVTAGWRFLPHLPSRYDLARCLYHFCPQDMTWLDICTTSALKMRPGWIFVPYLSSRYVLAGYFYHICRQGMTWLEISIASVLKVRSGWRFLPHLLSK